MLTLDQKEKLLDYLSGFLSFSTSPLPIGVIRTTDEDVSEVEDFLINADAVLVQPSEDARTLLDTVKSGAVVGVTLRTTLPPTIATALGTLADTTVGDAPKGKVLFIVPESLENTGVESIATSFCKN